MESVRHCCWVDEIVSEAPWIIDDEFLEKREIDYVAHDEEPYATENVGDAYAVVKVKVGYSLNPMQSHVSSLGRFLPRRRTPGVSTSELLERILTGYRKGEFDERLLEMGRIELLSRFS